MKTARLVWSGVPCILPWIAVAVVMIVTASVNQVLDLGSLSFDAFAAITDDAVMPSSGDLVSVSKHLLARIAWGVPAIGFALVAIAVMLTTLIVIVSCFGDIPRSERGKYFGFIVLAALALLFIAFYFGDQIMSEPEITTNLRKATVHRTSATYAVSMDSSFDAASYVIFLLLLCAASATLLNSANSTQTVAQLGSRIRQIQWLLYVGATALVFRAIEMYMLYRWPQVWFNSAQADAIDRMALALSTAHGSFFSAILVALYLPAAIVLRLRTKTIAVQAVAGTTEEPEAWLAKAGLKFSPIKEMVNLIAIIAPLLAGGSVAKLVGVLAV